MTNEKKYKIAFNVHLSDEELAALQAAEEPTEAMFGCGCCADADLARLSYEIERKSIKKLLLAVKKETTN